jgi:diguanylate cyclase (GGDEF)-like protein
MSRGTLRGNIALLAIAFVPLIAGVLLIVHFAVNSLLYWDATTTAESWAKHVADNVTDIEAIAAGEMPSEDSMRFFTRTQAIRYVFGFEIFDLQGRLQFASEGNRIMAVAGSSRSELAAATAAQKQTAVAIRQGRPPIRPLNYSEAFVPVIVDGEVRAVVAAYVDLTEKSAQFQRTFALAGAALLLITAAALAWPSVGWYRRTREIEFMAHHDALTALPNRASFLEKMERSLAEIGQGGGWFNVFMLDLDRFKDINDTLGHGAGDALLKEVAARLSASVRRTDLVARLGGDEFAIIQTDVRDGEPVAADLKDCRDNAVSLADRILAQFKQPFDLGGHHSLVDTSVGISLAPTDGSEPAELMKKADLALYEAKSLGRGGFCFFEPRLAAVANERHELETDMRIAFERNEFELRYQPIVDAQTRSIVAMEALPHWRHPERGMLPPDRFLEIAEDTGLINPLGAWMLRQSCRDAASWPGHVALAIKVSAVQLRRVKYVDLVRSALADAGVGAERLEIEVTETAVLANDANLIAVVGKLKAMGLSIALDGFGTGCSSLSLLKAFRFDKIKVDRLFTRDLGQRAECAAILALIGGFGRTLGLATVAAGIETEQQMTLVRTAGVSQAQGVLFGHAVAAASIDFTDGAVTATAAYA